MTSMFRYLFVRKVATKLVDCHWCHNTGYCGAAVCSCYLIPPIKIKLFRWQRLPAGFKWREEKIL